ncbi:hypothetical protein BJ912DRAFT_850297 [Pholiota molesta]|nr:hypothetical protein BJ912DRAFT_850297 [Pholiota molesta]
MAGVDSEQRICIVFAGRPDDDAYVAACTKVFALMEEAGKAAGLDGPPEPHRRGHFAAINVGISHGKGTVHPVNLDNGQHATFLEELLAREELQRMASFANKSFSLYGPRLYKYYRERLNPLFSRMPHLKRIFPAHISLFPTAALNFPPNVWTYQHRDVLNCPFGWCTIQALGSFDPTKGGHLVLWEARLVVEFPAGSCVLIPSATITHSNIPVAPGDARASFTQYAPGGLFRYVDYGFRLEKELKKQDPKLHRAMLNRRPDNWRIGLELLSRVDEILVEDS